MNRHRGMIPFILAAVAAAGLFGAEAVAAGPRLEPKAATILVDGGGQAAIAEAIRQAAPGDVIQVRPGDYSDGSADPLLIAKAGTAQAPITLQASGSPRPRLGNLEFSSAQYVVVEGFEITYPMAWVAIQVRGEDSQGITLRDMLIHDVDYGVILSDGANHRIEDSTLFNCINGGMATDAHCIEIIRARDTVLHGNDVSEFQGDAIQLYKPKDDPPFDRGTTLIEANHLHTTLGGCNENAVDIKGEIGTVIIRGNVLHGFAPLTGEGCSFTATGDPAGTAIISHEGSSGQVIIEGNEFFDMYAAVDVDGRGTIRNNLFHDFHEGMPTWSDTSHLGVIFAASWMQIYHNTFVNTPWAFHEYSYEGAEVVNNLFFNGGGTVAGTYRHNGWFGLNIRQTGIGDVVGDDPLLNADYSPKPGSPLIDAGEDIGVRTDFTGQPRDAKPDIGAYELVPLAPEPTFADVPFDHPYYEDIEALYQAGYTAGCNTDPLMYCPDNTMNRAESAVFVERGIHGTDGLPPQPTSQTFADLPLDSWAAKWAEALWQDHYTAGCGTDPLIYCPWQGHTRAEGCVFYLHMLHGPDYAPPQPAQQTFADVPLEAWYAKWVEAAYQAGLIPACGEAPLRFCPDVPLTRAVAAHMMARAKGLIPPPAADWWRPVPGVTWQWQITGKVDETVEPAQMFDIDLTDAIPSDRVVTVEGFGTVTWPKGINAGIIDRLHARGKVVICYLDSGAFESYEPDASLFPDSVIGNNTGWEGENWLDIRRPSWPAFAPLIWARFQLARDIGCDGVEPDQNNPLGNNPGFPITPADQKAWYLEVSRQAHARGLSVGMKNGIETTNSETVAAFDWNLNEECFQYEECDALTPFITAGKAVFQVEYTGSTAVFCPDANRRGFSSMKKRLELDAWREICFTSPVSTASP